MWKKPLTIVLLCAVFIFTIVWKYTLVHCYTRGIGFDLVGCDLRGADFSGANLAGVDLSGADLTGAKLKGANLTRANLSGVNLTLISSGNITGVPILPSGWILLKGYLIGPGITHTDIDLSDIDLSGAKLSNINFSNINLSQYLRQSTPLVDRSAVH